MTKTARNIGKIGLLLLVLSTLQACTVNTTDSFKDFANPCHKGEKCVHLQRRKYVEKREVPTGGGEDGSAAPTGKYAVWHGEEDGKDVVTREWSEVEGWGSSGE